MRRVKTHKYSARNYMELPFHAVRLKAIWCACFRYGAEAVSQFASALAPRPEIVQRGGFDHLVFWISRS
jgi:hypothetical protein